MSEMSLDDIGTAALDAIFDGAYEPMKADPAPVASEPESPSEPVVDAQGNLHGADGKFLPRSSAVEPVSEDAGTEEPAEEEAAEAAPEADAPEAEAPQTEDDLVLDADVLGIGDDHVLFTKYGGDLTKALDALAEGQRIIGERATEVGDLRRENEELQRLTAQIDDLRNLIALQQQASGVDWDEAIAENPENAVMMAVQYQNPAAFEQALEAWAAEEPIKAFTFLTDIQQQAAAPPPTTLDAEIEALKGRYPDLPQRVSAIQTEAEKRPALARLLNDQDPRTRAQALEDLYHLSRGAGTPDTSQAARRIVLQAKAEADAAKADAAVVSASNTAPPPGPSPSGDEALAAVLKEHLGLGDDFRVVG